MFFLVVLLFCYFVIFRIWILWEHALAVVREKSYHQTYHVTNLFTVKRTVWKYYFLNLRPTSIPPFSRSQRTVSPIFCFVGNATNIKYIWQSPNCFSIFIFYMINSFQFLYIIYIKKLYLK